MVQQLVVRRSTARATCCFTMTALMIIYFLLRSLMLRFGKSIRKCEHSLVRIFRRRTARACSNVGTAAQSRYRSPTGFAVSSGHLYMTTNITTIFAKLVLPMAVRPYSLARRQNLVLLMAIASHRRSFFRPSGVAASGTALYIVDHGNFAVRKID